MTDLFKALPRMKFRGIIVPIVGRTASFEHDDVRHKFVFRDGEFVESQGTKNRIFKYKIPFREGITKAPWAALFSEVFLRFVEACRDREPGELIDPVLGVFRAKVLTFSDEIDIAKRDGVDVDVEFTEAPSLDSLAFGEGALSGISPQRDARAIDDEIATVDWQQEEPPSPTVDPFLAIEGIGRQLEGIGNRTAAAFADVAMKAQRVEDTIDRLMDPRNYPERRIAKSIRETLASARNTSSSGAKAADPRMWFLRDRARRLRHDVLSTARGDTGPRVLETTTRSPMPVAAVAAGLKISVGALVALNPSVSQSPTVPAGTTIRYIRAAA